MGFSMSASLPGVQSGHLGLNVPAVSTGRGRGQARSQLDQDCIMGESKGIVCKLVFVLVNLP